MTVEVSCTGQVAGVRVVGRQLDRRRRIDVDAIAGVLGILVEGAHRQLRASAGQRHRLGRERRVVATALGTRD
ncbi:MAG: hypothetical protein IPK26_10665 [Planctomycetes bacterium]|nr:hypothetical protein [Planctomycetota bacterium]